MNKPIVFSVQCILPFCSVIYFRSKWEGNLRYKKKKNLFKKKKEEEMLVGVLLATAGNCVSAATMAHSDLLNLFLSSVS